MDHVYTLFMVPCTPNIFHFLLGLFPPYQLDHVKTLSLWCEQRIFSEILLLDPLISSRFYINGDSTIGAVVRILK